MKRVIIMGAAGRDFHNFNVYFRNNADYQVMAFTATQIPGIDNRIYPPVLAGERYPQGIPIFPETQLRQLIEEYQIDQVVFAYSDISNDYVMHKAAMVMASGADFQLLGPKSTMIKSNKPVIAVTATRTGCGKSQVSRYIGSLLTKAGWKVAVIRHPMPYGELKEQVIQRFATYDDLAKNRCTIEEREEYEPHIEAGLIVYAGADYQKILLHAEAEADVIIWDGGNNDFPFYEADIDILVADPLRPGDEKNYFPSEINLYRMDLAVINKVDSAEPGNVEAMKSVISTYNPKARILLANSRIIAENTDLIKGKKVLVVEDGPTLTHGQMSYGAGVIAAEKWDAVELVDPRPYAVGSIAETFREWPLLTRLIPAVGYGEKQISELEETINNTPADLVIIATPIDLSRFMVINKPVVRIRYELEEIEPQLGELIKKMLSVRK